MSKMLDWRGHEGDGQRVRRLGRPATLTAELSDQIVALVREVGALATAARWAGVPVSVAREWLARGLGNDPNRPRTALYASFPDGVEEVRGEFVARRIRRIEQAAEAGAWTGDAWTVERIDAETWARREIVREGAYELRNEIPKALEHNPPNPTFSRLS